MSHRKFEKPRKGNLGFTPKRRTRHHAGKIKSFPKDNKSLAPHLTAFAGVKAGMTHVVREYERIGSLLDKKEKVEAVTILETPPMRVVGMVGYIETLKGLRSLTTLWSASMGDAFKRRLYKNWHNSKRKAFTKYQEKLKATPNFAEVQKNRIAKYCSVVRLICHTQPEKTGLKVKKANIYEIQINGGEVQQKVDFGYSLFEKEVSVDQVFKDFEVIDIIGATKGHGFTGVIKRFGVRKLPRKTHRGLRKVGCIGSWHPSRIQWTIARCGQLGYHQRTEMNKKIYRIGKGADATNASTEFDLTKKSINPMGGFVHYGLVKNDFVMIQGCCVGTKKRPLVLRKSIHPRTSRQNLEPVVLKFIDTSSKMGHGRFQTSEEKETFFYSSKKVQQKLHAKEN